MNDYTPVKDYLQSVQVHQNWELLGCLFLAVLGGFSIGRVVGRHEK